METEEKHKCPPHHFVIDEYDVGRCIYCPEVRDFRKLQKKEARLLHRSYERGTRASIGAPRRPWGSQKGRRVA